MTMPSAGWINLSMRLREVIYFLPFRGVICWALFVVSVCGAGTAASFALILATRSSIFARRSAGVGFVMGTGAAGGIAGEFPGIGANQLVDGNLRHTTDFRAVYKTLVEGWFEEDATGIVPGAASFSALPLLK